MYTSKIYLSFLIITFAGHATAPSQTNISSETVVGQETIIAPTAQLLGKNKIGNVSSIGHYSVLENCTIGNNVKIHSHCVLENVEIKDGAEVGPFAHLKEHSVVEEKAIIGNFVEVTRSTVGKNSKAKHLSYLGDAQVGESVNIGAGSITCNYDGVNKNKTVIKQGTMIGSNNCLVAPLTIGEYCLTAAGSTITEDVPDHSLAIERNEQINKEGYAPKLLKKYHEKKQARMSSQ